MPTTNGSSAGHETAATHNGTPIATVASSTCPTVRGLIVCRRWRTPRHSRSDSARASGDADRVTRRSGSRGARAATPAARGIAGRQPHERHALPPPVPVDADTARRVYEPGLHPLGTTPARADG